MTIVSAEILAVHGGQAPGGYAAPVQYTVLIRRDDGTAEVRDVALADLRQLIPWLRTPGTELAALREKVESLEKTVSRMSRQIIDAAHPMPEVERLPLLEAKERLKKAGFRTELLHGEPDGAPAGTVFGAARSEEDPMLVILDVRHPLPEVIGLPEEEALALVRDAGFSAKVEAALTATEQAGVVMSAQRPDPEGMDVILRVARRVPELKGKNLDVALHELETQAIPVAGIRYRNVTDSPLNSVIDWRPSGESALVLVVASDKPNEVYTCEQVVVRHQPMQDCEVDSVAASALYRCSKRSLEIELTAVIRPRHRHSWVSVAEIWLDRVKMNNFATLHDVAALTPGVPQKLRLTYEPDRAGTSAPPPSHITLRLFTEFGDVQKYNAALTLELDLEWM